MPTGYSFGQSLSGTATYDGATFASLGVTPGTYQWTWGSGANQNFTLDIVGATVPEPATIALVGVGLLGLGLSRRKRAC